MLLAVGTDFETWKNVTDFFSWLRIYFWGLQDATGRFADVHVFPPCAFWLSKQRIWPIFLHSSCTGFKFVFHGWVFCESPFLKLLPSAPAPVPLIRRSHTNVGWDNDDSLVACPSLFLSTFLLNERRLRLSSGLLPLVSWHPCWRAGLVCGRWQ